MGHVVVVVVFVQWCPTLCNPTAALQALLSSTISWNLLKFMSPESVMLSNHLFLCHSLSFCLQSFPASGSFPIEWALHIRLLCICGIDCWTVFQSHYTILQCQRFTIKKISESNFLSKPKKKKNKTYNVAEICSEA